MTHCALDISYRIPSHPAPALVGRSPGAPPSIQLSNPDRPVSSPFSSIEIATKRQAEAAGLDEARPGALGPAGFQIPTTLIHSRPDSPGLQEPGRRSLHPAASTAHSSLTLRTVHACTVPHRSTWTTGTHLAAGARSSLMVWAASMIPCRSPPRRSRGGEALTPQTRNDDV